MGWVTSYANEWEDYFNYLGEGIPWWLSQWRIHLQCGRLGFDPWVGKIPWRREWQPTPVFLPGESHGQRSPEGCSPRGLKDTTEQLSTEISRNWATTHFLVFGHCLGNVVALLGMPFSLLMEDQGLVSAVDLSAIFDSFDSNRFMFCPQAMSFFQRLWPAPFPPISEPP